MQPAETAVSFLQQSCLCRCHISVRGWETTAESRNSFYTMIHGASRQIFSCVPFNVSTTLVFIYFFFFPILQKHNSFQSRWQLPYLNCLCIICLRHLARKTTSIYYTHWRRKWELIPVFLPGKSHGQSEPSGLLSMGSQGSDTTQWLQQCSHTFLVLWLRKRWYIKLEKQRFA